MQKVCTSTGTTEHTLRGKEIVHVEGSGTDGSSYDLHIFYDAQKRPAVVRYNGALYGYMYNLQGDVVALIDSAGSKVVEYRYDAWGRPLCKTGPGGGPNITAFFDNDGGCGNWTHYGLPK